ncbi:MAG: SUMF1/EgtB/PvdO family nonheme iron enzyme [Planctomycetales bacterium]|nr:SUMF1/EgtB/PvdO family nonheme iron enzyme [Planctomycetales bacterium]
MRGPQPIEAWKGRLDSLRRETLGLLDLVSEETAAAFAHPEWSPLRWHLGHIAYTESLWIRQTLRGLPPFDANYERLFDNIHTPRESRGDLPPLSDIRGYAEEIRKDTRRFLEEADWDQGNPLLADGYIVDFLWEHEAQHQELMTLILQLLPPERKRRRQSPEPADWYPSRRMIRVPGGEFTMGTPGPWFSYDNERPPKTVRVREYWVDPAPVTNFDFGAFVHRGGYSDSSLWTKEGWAWKERTRASLPVHWIPGPEPTAHADSEGLAATTRAGLPEGARQLDWPFDKLPMGAGRGPGVLLAPSSSTGSDPSNRLGGRIMSVELRQIVRLHVPWLERTMFADVPLRLDHPVTGVSRFEAEAYARWEGKRLLTEEEWEYAAAFDPATGGVRRYPWGDDPPSPTRANFARRYFGTTPVGAFPEGRSACGALDMGGNVWEWTSSTFSPYPGFVPDAYKDYSQPFFDGTYAVLRGGSWATQGPLLRCSFRNWYPPDVREILAGFRCARDA